MERKKIWEVNCSTYGKTLVVAENATRAINKAIVITNSMRPKGARKIGQNDIERCEFIGEAWD